MVLPQPCTVLAIECCRDMLVRIVQCGVATGGCFCAVDVATKSVKLGLPGSTQPSVDVYCMCGLCSGRLPRVRHWIPINWDVVVSWPTLGLGSLRTFSSRKDRRHKKKQPRPAVVEAAGSGYAPPNTCEGLLARPVVPVRQCRLAQPIVLDPSASELDAQSSSSDNSDSQSESSGSSGSKSSQSSCSSSSEATTTPKKRSHNHHLCPSGTQSPLLVLAHWVPHVHHPVPNLTQRLAHWVPQVGRRHHPVPSLPQCLAPFLVTPPAISCHRMVDVLLQSTGDSSSAAPIERPKTFRRSADASKPKPKPKPKPSPKYIYLGEVLSCPTTVLLHHCPFYVGGGGALSILWGEGGGDPALRELVPRSGTCDCPRVALVAGAASL